MQRRLFLQQAIAAPFLVSNWKAGIPEPYLEELTRMMGAAPVPGAVVGVVRDFKLAWIAPIGVQAAGTQDKITPATLFHAASLTKQITAYAALALRAEGKLDLDRPLVSWVDDLPDVKARTVTARHVLSHSSGFPNWRFAEKDKPVPNLVPAFAPGSRYSYSGEGYFYLQRVIEEITGRGIGQVVQDLVFDPLGMKSSALVWDPERLDRTALPHNRRGELHTGWDKAARRLHAWAAKAGRPTRSLRYADYAAAAGEGGNPALPDSISPNAAATMVTSAEDYARFLGSALRKGEIASQQISINEFLGWGLGWAIERAAGHTYVWQWGDNRGFKNFVLGEPSTGSAIFIFTNGDSGARVYDRVLTHATGHDHPALFWL